MTTRDIAQDISQPPYGVHFDRNITHLLRLHHDLHDNCLSTPSLDHKKDFHFHNLTGRLKVILLKTKVPQIEAFWNSVIAPTPTKVMGGHLSKTYQAFQADTRADTQYGTATKKNVIDRFIQILHHYYHIYQKKEKVHTFYKLIKSSYLGQLCNIQKKHIETHLADKLQPLILEKSLQRFARTTGRTPDKTPVELVSIYGTQPDINALYQRLLLIKNGRVYLIAQQHTRSRKITDQLAPKLLEVDHEMTRLESQKKEDDSLFTSLPEAPHGFTVTGRICKKPCQKDSLRQKCWCDTDPYLFTSISGHTSTYSWDWCQDPTNC